MDTANEKQAVAKGEQGQQAEACGRHRPHIDDMTMPTTDEHTLVAGAAGGDVDESRRDALAQSRLGWTLWRLSDCKTLREELGDEQQFDCL
ncbi:hypothetical protein pdul_cds_890 [Pandoravirus dulcis]|uniref:Uncharacterized protein n=1 Tax=Pandoravirus dulcis TaxID=1349409 RepID=S4VZ34_9VIRU|nr:hypothetical protein pdul_cds_890 [Pandoravirus dulcis]AGO83119.1 hypothetical protein pdul_cds_890 [Pandoravirus dulcis]